jgi:hypothetical protein
MSKEKPKDDSRQQTDKGSSKQTDKPWKGNPEKEQNSHVDKDDLERWQRNGYSLAARRPFEPTASGSRLLATANDWQSA